MAECLKRDDVRQMLHGIGGCGADPDTWADGWDKAIDTAIGEMDKLPAVSDSTPASEKKIDCFSLHYKTLSVCEKLMQVRRTLESMTDDELEAAISLLKRLLQGNEKNDC